LTKEKKEKNCVYFFFFFVAIGRSFFLASRQVGISYKNMDFIFNPKFSFPMVGFDGL